MWNEKFDLDIEFNNLKNTFLGDPSFKWVPGCIKPINFVVGNWLDFRDSPFMAQIAIKNQKTHGLTHPFR